MKIDIRNTKNEKVGEMDLPSIFNEPVNADIIKTIFAVDMAEKRQPYGSDPQAGKKSVAKLSRRRRKYRGSYGIGISRVPRKIMSRSGIRFNWVGAFAPGMVGGRRAHPPKAQKIRTGKINRKERQKALRAALAATMQRDLVASNGFRLPQSYPFAIDDSFEKMEKTKEVTSTLDALGFGEELNRTSKRTRRAGRGTMRSRPYRTKKGLLLIVSNDSSIGKAARNIPGVEIINSASVNIAPLAPGARPGRAVLCTKTAITDLGKRLSSKVSA